MNEAYECEYDPLSAPLGLSEEVEDEIIQLYSLGMNYANIQQEIKEKYSITLSKDHFNRATGKLVPAFRQWQQRPLKAIYPVLWLDAIRYNIRKEGRYVGKIVYTVLALDVTGRKEILGLYLAENTDINFWLSVFVDLKNRGVNDILIACEDSLSGFAEAMSRVFAQTEVQLCMVHQIRNSLKYVDSKHHQIFKPHLKQIYGAVSKAVAEEALDKLASEWSERYPLVIQSWRRKWEKLSEFLTYPANIRKMIYSNNMIEFIHRQFRLLTKGNVIYPNENSLLKLLYMGIMKAEKRWTMPVHHWNPTLSQLGICFNGRLDQVITL